MHANQWAKAVGVLVALAMGAAGSAAAINVVGQETYAQADARDVVSNSHHVSIGGNDWPVVWEGMGGGHGANGNAATNCQLLLGVNTIVVNLVLMEVLGLVEEHDTLIIDAGFGVARGLAPIWDGPSERYSSPAGNATCDQHVGTIKVHQRIVDGWGAPAPGADAAALASALLAPPGDGIGRGPSANVVLQRTIAGAFVEDVVSNDAYVDIDGDGNAVSNCQLLVGWNTLVVNAAAVGVEGTVSDVDVIDANLTGPILPPGPPTLAGAAANGLAKPWEWKHGHEEGPESHCRQSVESIELRLGIDLVGPAS